MGTAEETEPNTETLHPLPAATTPADLPNQAKFQLDPATAALYQPAEPEDFRGMRRRFDSQEIWIFGPLLRLRQHQAISYKERPPTPHVLEPIDDLGNINHAVLVHNRRHAFCMVHG